MADYEMNSEVKHITKIGFDTSGVAGELQTLETQLGATTKKLNTDANYKIKPQIDTSSLKLTSGEFDDYISNLKKSIEEQGTISSFKTTDTFSYEDGEKRIASSKAIVEYVDKENRSRTETYNLVKAVGEEEAKWQQVAETNSDKILQRSKQEEAAEKARLKSVQDIGKAELQAYADNAKYDAQKLKAYQDQTNALNILIARQKEQITKTTTTTTGADSDALVAKMQTNLNNLLGLQTQLSKTDYVSPEQLSQINNAKSNITTFGSELKELQITSKKTQSIFSNFVDTLADKARWLIAFYLIQQIKQGFTELISTVKETEDAIIDLKRVLDSDLNIDDKELQAGLYGIAENYGRTFQEVSDSAVKFAQAGYEWNDVLKLTESTMLALNTAELEVETSTTGLIAVMSQFNIEAEDMEGTIDKINITADNFPVTSEKIVSALQRMGSAATGAGANIDQSIGLITALSESTGRSGENIGTALNSLFQYTSKESSLDIFANVDEEMANLVQKFNDGSASIIDVWNTLSEKLKDDKVALALSQSLEGDEGYGDFASGLESDASEITAELRDIYGTAGTYRQNYFIALLDSMDTYTNALEGMSGAEGYSLAENETAMESLTRQYASLQAEVKALAVEFGNEGFLDLLKWLVSVGSGTTKVIEAMGGLRSVLILVGTALATVKSEAFLSFITSTVKIIPTSITAIRNWGSAFVMSAKSVKSGSLSMKNAVIGLFGSVSNLATIGIGVALTAWSAYTQAQEKARQSTIDSTSEFNEQLKSLSGLREEYYEVVNSVEDETTKNNALAEMKSLLIDKYDLETDALNGVNGARESYLDLVNQEAGNQVRDYYALNEGEIEKARKEIEEGFSHITVGLDMNTPDFSNLVDEFDDLTLVETYEGMTNLAIEGDTVYEKYDNLLAIVTELQGKGGDLSLVEEQAITEFQSYLKLMNEEMEDSGVIYSGYMDLIKTSVGAYDEATLGIDNLTDANEWLANALENVQGLSDNEIISAVMLGQLKEELNEVYSSLSIVKTASQDSGIDGIAFDAEVSAEATSNLSDQIDGVQSAYSTINSAMSDYNSGNGMSIDMIQSLLSLSGEYASMLSFEGGQLQYLDSATNQAISSKQDLLKAYIAEQTASQIVSYVKSLDTEANYANADSSDSARIGAVNLTNQLAVLSNDFFATGINAEQAGIKIANALQAQGYSSDIVNKASAGINQILNNSKAMYNQIGSIANSPSTWGGGSGGGIDKANDQAKKANDARKKELEAQKEAVEKYYDDQIDALKEVQEENDRIIEQEEYYQSLKEKNIELSSAQARSGVEYREAEAEALDDIAELEKEWNEQLEDWKIEDKIAQLESLRDAEVESLDAQISALQEASSSMASSVVGATGSALSGMSSSYSDTLLETTEETMDETASTMEEVAKSSYDIMLENFFGVMYEDWDSVFEYSLEVAEISFDSMYNIFSNNFMDKASADMEALFVKMASAFSYSIPTSNSSGTTNNTSTTNNSSSIKTLNSYFNASSNDRYVSSVYRMITDLYD